MRGLSTETAERSTVVDRADLVVDTPLTPRYYPAKFIYTGPDGSQFVWTVLRRNLVSPRVTAWCSVILRKWPSSGPNSVRARLTGTPGVGAGMGVSDA